MIELTGRQRRLIRALCRKDAFVTTAELARTIDASERTVRAELNVVESYVPSFDASLERITGRGIRLVCDGSSREALLSALDHTAQHTLSLGERDAVAEMLLVTHDVVKFRDIADACRISRQTVMAHFDDVESFFRQNGLEVLRDQGVGLHVEGREIDIRRCFLGLVSNASTFSAIRPYADEFPSASCRESAKCVIEKIERALNIQFNDLATLELTVAYSFQRIASGHILDARGSVEDGHGVAGDDQSPAVLAKVPDELKDPDLQGIVLLLRDEIESKAECVFLASVMLSQRSNRGAGFTVDGTYEDEAQAISRDLINALRELHVIEESPLRHLIDGLTAHIRAAIYRYRNGNQIQNETPMEIMASIPLLWDFTRKQMAIVEHRYGIALNEAETAYIAMYLDTIYETSARDSVSLNVLFVCSFGLASSSILMMRLSHALTDCNVIGPITTDEAREYLVDHQVDLVISTNDFSCGDTSVLTVDPLLGQGALDSVKAKLAQASYAKMCTHFLRSYLHTSDSRDVSHAVREFVRPEDIQVGIACSDWRNAIRIAAAPLLSRGVVEQRYVDRMITAVEDFGPYMVLTTGTAYVHAGVNDGIHENCIAICVLADEIPFGSMDEKRIKTVIVIGVRDRERNDLLTLAPIFEREENIRALEMDGLDISTVLNLRS